MIPHDHAARIARRLARHTRKADPLLLRSITARLWDLLETAPGARSAFDCPTERTLAEHAATLTPAQIDEAAAHLETLKLA